MLGLARGFAAKNAHTLINPPAPRQAHAVLLEDATHLLVGRQAQSGGQLLIAQHLVEGVVHQRGTHKVFAI